MKKFIYLSVISALLFASCDEDEKVPLEPNELDFWTAHHVQEWDSTSTVLNLLGTWVWEYNVCCPFTNGNEGVNKISENVRVTFTDSNVQLIENGEVTQTTSWSINQVEENLFQITSNDYFTQLFIHGWILFAEDRVVFFNSHLDGSNNYFIKDTSLK